MNTQSTLSLRGSKPHTHGSASSAFSEPKPTSTKGDPLSEAVFPRRSLFKRCSVARLGTDHVPSPTWVASLLLAITTTSVVYSQQARTAPDAVDTSKQRTDFSAAKPTANSTAEEDDIKTLSPFIVRTSPDGGYYPENTLAGSRLKTNLGDLAASITVVTRQQMLDTASLDLNDVFLYEANTEGTGNFTNFSYDDSGGAIDSNSIAPSSSNRVRGIGPVDRARNFYPSIQQLPFDVYNTESIEINRGPNSLLFGLGSAAGIVNQSSSGANLSRPMAEFGGQISSHNGYRSSFRANQVLIPQRLAIFAAGLYDSPGFPRKPSYDIARRGYVAVAFAPSRNTTIRANAERYSNDSRRPNFVTPRDGFSEYFQSGRPAYDPTSHTVTLKGVASTIGLNATSFPSTMFLQAAPFLNLPYMIYAGGTGTPEMWLQSRLSASGIGAFSVPRTGEVFYAASDTSLRKINTTKPLYTMPGITDKSVYDWDEINISSGNVSWRRAYVYNVEVDQKLLENLFMQAGWYREDFSDFNFAYNAASPIYIDPNTRLLDGSTNPHFGSAFFNFGNAATTRRKVDNDNLRLSLAYALDFGRRDGWVKWFGKHNLFAFGSRRQHGHREPLEGGIRQ